MHSVVRGVFGLLMVWQTVIEPLNRVIGALEYPKSYKLHRGLETHNLALYYNGTIIDTANNIFGFSVSENTTITVLITDAEHIHFNAQGNNILSMRIPAQAQYTCFKVTPSQPIANETAPVHWRVYQTTLEKSGHSGGFVDIPLNTLVIPLSPLCATIKLSEKTPCGTVLVQLTDTYKNLHEQLIKAQLLLIDLKQLHRKKNKKEILVNDNRHAVSVEQAESIA